MEGSNPTLRRRGLIERLDSAYGSAISDLGPHVSYLAISRPAAQEKMRKLEEFVAVKRGEVQRIAREAEVALESVRGSRVRRESSNIPAFSNSTSKGAPKGTRGYPPGLRREVPAAVHTLC